MSRSWAAPGCTPPYPGWSNTLQPPPRPGYLGHAVVIFEKLPVPSKHTIDLTAFDENGVTTLEGNFVQVGHDGELSEGQFYLRRPGRIRFEYQPPNQALVIADGTWVGVYDTRLNTLDRIPLGQTPLSILLKKRVDLRRENAVRGIDMRANVKLDPNLFFIEDPA